MPSNPFSSKTYYYTSVVQSPVYGDNTPTDYLSLAVKNAIRHSQPIVESLRYTYNKYLFKKSERYLKYGTETYINGLPQFKHTGETTTSFNANVAAYEAYVRTLYPAKTLIFTQTTRGLPPGNVIAHKAIYDNYGSIDGTVKLGSKTYTFDRVQSTNNEYYDDGDWVFPRYANAYYPKYSFNYLVTLYNGSATYPLYIYAPGLDETHLHLYTEFYFSDETASDLRYHYLDIEEHGDSLLLPPDSITGPLTGSFYPMPQIRQNRVNMPDTDPRYDTTERLLSKLDLDIETLNTSIDEGQESEYIYDTFIQFNVNIYDDTPEVKQYLFEFFNAAETTFFDDEYISNKDDEDAGEMFFNYTYSPVKRFILSEEEYECVISYFNYVKSNIVGSIGAVGDVVVTVSAPDRVRYTAIDDGEEYDYYVETPEKVSEGWSHYKNNNGNKWIGETYALIQDSSTTYTISKQIDATNYTQIVITGLQVNNIVPADNGFHYNVLGLSERQEDQTGFVIPLHTYFVDLLNLKPKQKELLYYKALYATFHTEKQVRLSWQKRTIQFVVALFQVWAMAYGMNFWGAGGIAGTSATATAAGTGLAGLGTGLAAVTAIATNVAIAVGTQKLVEVLIEELGLSGALAILVAAVAAFYTTENKSMTQILMDSVKAVTTVNDAYTKVELDGLREESLEIENLNRSVEEELAMHKDYLIESNEKAKFDYFYIETIVTPRRERAESFFNRTLDTSPLVQTLNMPSSYVGSMLQLPNGIS